MLKYFFKISLLVFTLFSVYVDAGYSVTTESGTVDGYKKNNVLHWDDIPYAQPPLKELRWKAPRKINDPDSIILPKSNNFCIQRPSSLGGAQGKEFFVGTEDCLYLDVIAPAKTSTESYPVMFWIHGGGNTSGLKDLYDFNKIVKKHDVVVVRINYRLGPFGWFTHPAIQDLQEGLDKSSNFGTLDIIEALKWVQGNIHLFNGDPDNVTIFGESAGGHNVLSLLVSKESNSLFHKAISMSGYTTSITPSRAYNQKENTPTSNYTSSKIVTRILNDRVSIEINKDYSKEEIRNILLNLSSEEFFKYYADREPYEELPLLTSDGIVIPKIGLRSALQNPAYIYNVPTIAGSNRDEVKLWLASAKYFVDLEFSPFGKLVGIPKVVLNDIDAYEAFNYYRSSAWKIRGVDIPLQGLQKSGNQNLYSYRYDWDDHRQYLIADFKQLIGAAHATEIPLLAGNSKLVGGYPLSDFIYPPSVSKFYLSRNMMKFWTNFAKNGAPGISSNGVEWRSLISKENAEHSFIILDNKKNLRMESNKNTFKSLALELFDDDRVNDIEKCVILLQMYTFVGDDLYDENIKHYPGTCNRSESEMFIRDNASYIEY